MLGGGGVGGTERSAQSSSIKYPWLYYHSYVTKHPEFKNKSFDIMKHNYDKWHSLRYFLWGVIDFLILNTDNLIMKCCWQARTVLVETWCLVWESDRLRLESRAKKALPARWVSDSEWSDDGVVVQLSRSVVVGILVRIYPVHSGVRVVVAGVQDNVGYQLHDLVVIYHDCIHTRARY